MTEPILGEAYAEPPAPAEHRRRRGRNAKGCLAVLVALAVVFGGGYFAVTKGVEALSGYFGSAEDFDGPGRGKVLFEVSAGDSVAEMGRNLKEAKVVASVEAFTDAAAGESRSTGIQVGFYRLKKEMAAADALEILVDPANLIKNTVTIPEGSRVGQVVTAIVKATDFKQKEITRLLDRPKSIGLPAEAGGNPEGYLFPATYSVSPSMTAKDLLTQMVAKTAEVEADLDIEGRAAALDLTPHELITVASILEYEANNDEDYAKVARVIYNRIEAGMALQMDSTVSYASQREGDVWTTEAERNSESLYNTYQHTGLPPGPIGSPGAASIEAALNPADGNWIYFVPDFEKGTTLFTDDYNEHLRNAEKAKEYCRTHEEC